MYWQVFRKSVRRSDRQASTPGCSTRPLIVRKHSQWLRWESNGHRRAAVVASLVLSRGGLPVAYRAAVVPDGVEPSFPGCRPGVVAVGPRDHVFQVESPGVAPGSMACGASVILLDHDPMFFQAEAVGLEPASGMSAAACFPRRFLTNSDDFRNRSHQGGSRPTLRRCPDSNSQAVISRHLFSRQGPHPAGWLPLFKLRRLESNQHEESVSSYH